MNSAFLALWLAAWRWLITHQSLSSSRIKTKWILTALIVSVVKFFVGMQRWRSGESTRLPPMWPGFDFQIWRHMWVEFLASLLCTERFSPGAPVSPLLRSQHLTWLDLCRFLISVCSVPNQCPSARTIRHWNKIPSLSFPFLSYASSSACIYWTKYWYWRHTVSLKVINKCLAGRSKFTVNSR